MRHLFLSMLLVLSATTLTAQSDSAKTNLTKTDSTKIVDSSAFAKVYVIRSTGHVASAVNLRVVVDEVMKCKIRNNRHAIFMVEPGTHLFNATSWDKPGAREKYGLKLPVEAGKSYYLSMRIKPRFMEVEIFMEEITYNSAAPLLAKYKLDSCD